MKKADYIARYGEEGWARQLERQRVSQAKAKGKPYVPKDKSINYYQVVVTKERPEVRKADRSTMSMMIRNITESRAEVYQKALKKAWAKVSNKPHIVIVTAGNANMKKKVVNYIAELNQLNLQKSEMDDFSAVVREIFLSIDFTENEQVSDL